MNRPALSRALAACTALPLVAVAPTPAGADDPELIEVCTTYTLSAEEVADGQVSEVTCEWVDPDAEEEMALFAPVVARHYDSTGASGAHLQVTGSCGQQVVLTSSQWNNRISSTRHYACGTVKHYTGIMAGSVQMTQGPSGWWENMNGTLNNNVSSLAYGD